MVVELDALLAVCGYQYAADRQEVRQFFVSLHHRAQSVTDVRPYPCRIATDLFPQKCVKSSSRACCICDIQCSSI